MAPTVITQLRQRTKQQGSSPLTTFYRASTGERTELSAISFANWVDKTANLMGEELDLAEGDVLDLRLADTEPGHWVTLVWQVAAWQLGVEVAVGGMGGGASVTVVGPDWAGLDAAGQVEDPVAETVVACSLHPLGLGFNPPLPAPLVDFTAEVRSYPDVFTGISGSADAPAWRDGDRTLSLADLSAPIVGPPQRWLVVPTDPWTTTRDALLTPLLTGGSAVVVVGADDDQRQRIAAQEQATR